MGRISKTLALVLVLICLFSPLLSTDIKAESSTSAPAIERQKTFSGYYKDHVQESSNLIQTSDGGYAFMDLGYTYQSFLEPATVFKVNSKGNLQWSKTVTQFSGEGIIQTNDKGYEISGWWYLPNSSLAVTPTLIKMGSDGNIQWIQNYTTLPDLGVNHTTYISPNYNDNQAGGNISTSDNGSIYWTYGNITKTDSNNNTQWTKTLTYPVVITNSSAPILLTSGTETSDGAIAALGIAPAGYSTRPTQGTIYLTMLEPFMPIPSATQLPTPLPTPTSTHHSGLPPENSILLIVVVVVMAIIVVVISLLLFRRHRKTVNLVRSQNLN